MLLLHAETMLLELLHRGKQTDYIYIYRTLQLRHDSNSPECLEAQSTNNGEDVETFIVRPERTRYVEYADTGSFFAVFLSLAVPQAI